ncbi:transposase [Cellulosilyticum ruminicola]|uniref:transposase n=1 Tax=Cellulosilyticum ruminicola TaxID=425254 RepID=UPI0006D0A50C|nr:transposase [Cellulosilyticum ruminicola]
MIGKNHVSILHLNAAFDVETNQFVDAVVQKGIKENECSAACELVDRLSEKYPVIIMANNGYENYNLFAHIEERLFDYVIRIKDVKSNGILLQEIDVRLVMYNFNMSITLKTPLKEKGKEKDLKHHLQVNFTQATKICLHFFSSENWSQHMI